MKLLTSTLKPTRPLILLLLLLVLLALLLTFILTSGVLIRTGVRNTSSNDEYRVKTPPTPQPLSQVEVVEKVYSVESDVMKEIKYYEIVLKDATISTLNISISTQDDLYFVNREPSVTYKLEIYQTFTKLETVDLPPNRVHVSTFDHAGRYKFVILGGGSQKFTGDIYVQ